MELELEYDDLKCFSCVLDTVVRREEIQEAIVSDAMPDIGTVINVSGCVCLQHLNPLEGGIGCDGVVDTAVLFTPEDGGEVCAIGVQVPFHWVTDAPGVAGNDRVLGEASLVAVDVKLMNPRKVMVRVEVAVHLRVFTGHRMALPTSVPGIDNALQLRRMTVEHDYVAHTAQRIFSFDEGVSLSSGQPRIKQLLHCSGVAYCTEARVTGSKVIVKGGVRICVRYNGEDERYTSGQFDLPVSQVLDGGGCSERAVVCPILQVRQLQVSYYDENSIALSMELNAECIVWEHRVVETICDAYSTAKNCTCQWDEAPVFHIHGFESQLIPFRQSLDVELAGAEILDQTVVLSEIITGGDVSTKGRLKAFLCIQDPLGHKMRLEQTCYIDLPVKHSDSQLSVCLLDCVCVPSAGGAEMRGTIMIREMAGETKAVRHLSEISESELANDEGSKRPSAVLRKLQPGETLWDIGKRCCATVNDIMTVNQLKDEASAAGKFLLIPRHR